MDSWKSYLSQTPVDCLIEEQRKWALSRQQQQIDRNRKFLCNLLSILIFLAKQNLALRGHDETENSCNRGNFLELVNFLARYDPLIDEQLQSAKGNCTYLSPQIQNELIAILADDVVKRICVDIKEAKYFSLLLDEATDISRHEQVSFVLRFVTNLGKVQERFIGVVKVDKCTLIKTVEDIFDKHGLNFENLCGQCYDGASNMSGQYSGLQRRIFDKNQKALYVHCYAHILNLIIVEACTTVNAARDFFGTVELLYIFIEASSKRHSLFVSKQSSVTPVTLKRLSDTRWSCRIDSLKAIDGTLPNIIATLEEIEDTERNGRIVCEAKGLLNSICSFDFILLFVIFLDLLSYSKAVSDYLQCKDIDFISAVEMVKSLEGIPLFFLLIIIKFIGVLQDKRCEEEFEKYYIASQERCEGLGVKEQDLPPPKRRRVSGKIDDRETQHHYSTGKQKFKVEVYYRIIDVMLNALQRRFSSSTNNVLQAFSVLHPSKLGNPANDLSGIKEYCDVDIDVTAFEREYRLFSGHAEFQSCKSVDHILQMLYQKGLNYAYPNITTVYCIYLTLPVTSASVERSFSKLKLVKNALRSTMCENRLTSLLILSIEKDLVDSTDLNNIIDNFCAIKPRRLLLQ